MTQEWKCKAHSLQKHDIFINYRVKTETELATKLYYALSNFRSVPGSFLSVYLDSNCLNIGEDFEIGFLNGLRFATCILLLISEAGIEGIKNADKWQDNVLLEYEYALERYETKTALVLPILIGRKQLDTGSRSDFNGFGTKFPDALHNGKGKNIKNTMDKLFKIQGIHYDSRYEQMCIQEIITSLSKHTKTSIIPGINEIPAIDIPDIPDIPILKWKFTNVAQFLTAKNLERYIPIFKENAIDGNLFKDLTDEVLQQDFKIENKFHRKVITVFIQEQLLIQQEAKQKPPETKKKFN